MYMIPAVQESDNGIMVPIYGTNDYCYIEWNEDECVDAALGRACGLGCKKAWREQSFKIAPSDLNVVDKDKHYEGFEFHVYEVRCQKTQERYYMIACSEIEDFSEVFHTVCVPYNRINLLKFYSEYLCPLAGIKYRL